MKKKKKKRLRTEKEKLCFERFSFLLGFFISASFGALFYLSYFFQWSERMQFFLFFFFWWGGGGLKVKITTLEARNRQRCAL